MDESEVAASLENNEQHICEKCAEKNCDQCEDKKNCKCDCNKESLIDVMEKFAAASTGVGMIASGLAITLTTVGMGAVALGGVLMGAGISSTYLGLEKIYKHEKINGYEYMTDVSLGAVTGGLTGGIGAATEIGTVTLVKHGSKELIKTGAKNLAVKAGVGGISGITSKFVDEVKNCTLGRKDWKYFGKNVDENGVDKGTAVVWATSALKGVVGGAVGDVTGHISNSVARVAVNKAANGVTDIACQAVNIATGIQHEYEPIKTLNSITSGIIPVDTDHKCKKYDEKLTKVEDKENISLPCEETSSSIEKETSNEIKDEELVDSISSNIDEYDKIPEFEFKLCEYRLSENSLETSNYEQIDLVYSNQSEVDVSDTFVIVK